jgi:hypothetical protein
MRRLVPIATLAVSFVVLSCAQAAVAPKIVTIRNSGATLTVQKGAHRQLHLTARYPWGGLRVKGSAVRAVGIYFLRDPGYRAWDLMAQARGKAVVTAVGYANEPGNCDRGTCSPRFFRVTFVVRAESGAGSMRAKRALRRRSGRAQDMGAGGFEPP